MIREEFDGGRREMRRLGDVPCELVLRFGVSLESIRGVPIRQWRVEGAATKFAKDRGLLLGARERCFAARGHRVVYVLRVARRRAERA